MNLNFTQLILIFMQIMKQRVMEILVIFQFLQNKIKEGLIRSKYKENQTPINRLCAFWRLKFPYKSTSGR